MQSWSCCHHYLFEGCSLALTQGNYRQELDVCQVISVLTVQANRHHRSSSNVPFHLTLQSLLREKCVNVQPQLNSTKKLNSLPVHNQKVNVMCKYFNNNQVSVFMTGMVEVTELEEAPVNISSTHYDRLRLRKINSQTLHYANLCPWHFY